MLACFIRPLNLAATNYSKNYLFYRFKIEPLLAAALIVALAPLLAAVCLLIPLVPNKTQFLFKNVLAWVAAH